MLIQLDKSLIQNGKLKAIDLVKVLIRDHDFNTDKTILDNISLKDLKKDNDYIKDAELNLITMTLTLTLKASN